MSSDEVAVAGLCVFENCSCCVRDTEPCPDLEQQCLSKHGYSNHTCMSDEEALSGLCKYDNCSCCVKGTDCAQTSECQIADGRCDRTCVAGEEPVNDNCLESCTCCTEGKCPETQNCRDRNGICRPMCTSTETSISGICGTDLCFCCVSGPPNS
ncbi:oncoprotein-induced transcript 3 protein-like [Penaeus monodon]|uniref:oncoprotein-induced transcript 3 protein-like n=1 Tax=Penaeus monodon TaxID=6687 RepID=UPI0018A74C6D|nr:oncoprotein-induced transcript 3 protein-like [Penaeus monodon]